jgi:hypothetical protein
LRRTHCFLYRSEIEPGRVQIISSFVIGTFIEVWLGQNVGYSSGLDYVSQAPQQSANNNEVNFYCFKLLDFGFKQLIFFSR